MKQSVDSKGQESRELLAPEWWWRELSVLVLCWFSPIIDGPIHFRILALGVQATSDIPKSWWFSPQATFMFFFGSKIISVTYWLLYLFTFDLLHTL